MVASNKDRIKRETVVFDQKVKDKMIDLDQTLNEIKHIQQKVNERANKNEVFQ